MMKLSELIQKIDLFYNATLSMQKNAAYTPSGAWISDEDEEAPDTERNPVTDKSYELYNKLREICRVIRDESIRSDALIIADQYGKAVELGDGFNAVKTAIKIFLNVYFDDIDPDDENNPLNELENILNEINSDLTKRAKAAGGGINKGDSAEAQKAIKEVKNQFDRTDIDDTLSGKSTSDLSDIDPSAVGTFDFTGGVGKEEGDRSGRGWHGENRKPLKDWIQAYKDEKERYIEELQGEKNLKIANTKTKLIEILNKLEVATEKLNKDYEEFQVAPNEASEKKLNNSKEEVKSLKALRAKAKMLLRADFLNSQKDKIKEIYAPLENKGSSIEAIEQNPALLANDVNKTKYTLYQELKLRELLISKDLGKGAETKARKLLLIGLQYLSKTDKGFETIKKLIEQIKEAEGKKIPIKEYWEEQAKVLNKTKGVHLSRERAPGERKILTSTNFERPFRQLKQHVSNVKMGDKKEVIDKWREKIIINANENERKIFGPYLDAIAAERAANKEELGKASPAMEALYAKLKEMVHEFADKINTINYRMQRFQEMYSDIQNFISDVSKLAKINKAFYIVKKSAGVNDVEIKPDLTEEESQILTNLSAIVSELAERKYIIPYGTEGERKATKIHLEATRDALLNRLSQHIYKPKNKVKVEVTDDETGLVTVEEMTEEEANTPTPGKEKRIIRGHMNRKQRKIAIAKLRKQSFVDTSTSPEVNSLLNDSSLNSIKDDKEYAHQVFQKMLAMIDAKMKRLSDSE